MRISVQYFDGCPHWQIALERITETLESTALKAEVTLQEVTAADAERLRFGGSPTILVDGEDPFPRENTSFALSCRMYRTERGVEGSPSVTQLATVLAPGRAT